MIIFWKIASDAIRPNYLLILLVQFLYALAAKIPFRRVERFKNAYLIQFSKFWKVKVIIRLNLVNYNCGTQIWWKTQQVIKKGLRFIIFEENTLLEVTYGGVLFKWSGLFENLSFVYELLMYVSFFMHKIVKYVKYLNLTCLSWAMYNSQLFFSLNLALSIMRIINV